MDELRTHARRAYEGGRIRHGLGLALASLPPTVLAVAVGAPEPVSLVLGAVLFVVVTVLGWRGQGWARGALPGLAVGGLLGAIPLLLISCGIACVGEPCPASGLALLFGGGVGGGTLLGLRTTATVERIPYAVSAGTVALIAASIGCALLGVGAVLGVGLALIASVPVAAALRSA